MLFRPAPLYRLHNLKATPFQYFLQGFYNASCLIVHDVEGIGSGAGAYYHRLLPLMKRKRHPPGVFAHHAVYHAVKEHFQLARHIAPITRRTDNQRIRLPDMLQHPLRIVFGQAALQRITTFHATDARMYL